MTGARVRAPSTGSGAETWESPFLKPGISSSSCEPPVCFQHFLYSLLSYHGSGLLLDSPPMHVLNLPTNICPKTQHAFRPNQSE